MNCYTKSAIFLILLFYITSSHCQIYNFKTFNEDNGLPQNYIYSISQSKDGYLFLSTGNGFVAFGGNKFKTYTTKDSLCENFVNIHFKDSRGITWLGHYQNGISYLNNLNFSKVKNSEKFGSKIISFAEDKNKNIWFVVQGKGVFFIDTSFNIQNPEFPNEYNFNSICLDNDGNLLCVTDNGLLIFDLKNIKKPLLIKQLLEFENKNIKFIIKDALKQDFFWVAIQGDGVYGVKKKNNEYQISSEITKELNSSSKNILSIYSDHLSNLWISLSDEGLKKVTFLDDNIKRFYSIRTINQNNGLQNPYIISIFEDFEKNMWFGTFGGGLIQMPNDRFNFYKNDLNNDIKSILIDYSENILLGTNDGLIFYNNSDSTKAKLFNSKNGFVTDLVNTIFQDKNGIIWIGTDQNGIFTYNITTKKFENFSKINRLKILTINCITQNKDGQILIGTNEGAYFITPKSSNITLLTTVEGLLHNNVINIFCDSKNRIWFNSFGAPPYYLEKNEFNALKDIPTVSVNSVTEDRNGLIWLSTEGDGVFSYDGVNVKNYKVDDGLLSNFCYSVIFSKNELWVSHKNGLTCIKKSGKEIICFNKSDGLLFSENNTNSCFKDINGNLWFGTTEGLVLFNFEKNKNRNIEPKTSVLLLTLNNDTYTTNDKIDVKYKSYSARFDYIGISLEDPIKVTYKYRLLGLDTTWRFTKERFIEYSNITNGIYTFQVYACNRNGIWNTKPAEISFKIGLPYWEKIWFWIVVFIVLIGVIYSITIIRTRSLEKTKTILENTVEEKTSQLRTEKLQIERIKLILEERDKDITDSINYAKKIQEALLPSKENLLKCFPHSFVYFKPRDIVSGDFYWFAERSDWLILSVADCTGHGVPGALMSMLGISFMNEIVIRPEIKNASKILDEMRLYIINSFQQKGDTGEQRDGMDMSVVAINKKNHKIHFAGANSQLLIISKGVLKEIKGNRMPISHYIKMSNFTNHEVQLQKGDALYLFSDGYSSQYDQKDEKKFTTRRLKQLLIRIADMSSVKQYEEIDNALNLWKGDQRQIDDITVVGLKI